ncbi:MAG: carboxylating nicotinate-nucleotide diphosphorylase [Nanoarchaeota archaeon]|nr:carboxylating nicotinate-nucleotide diphosphorylase [Nanoarchaeota archaeon]
MDRGDFVRSVLDYSKELVMDSDRYRNWVLDVVLAPIIADVGGRDVTGHAVLSANKSAKGAIIAQSSFLVAGMAEAVFLYEQFYVTCNIKKQDGERVRAGMVLIEVEGKEQDILKAERGILEVIARMSGIATGTAKIVSSSSLLVACTRKSLFPFIDKKAVSIGGGLTHRLGLFDAVLIKDNHLTQLKSEAEDYVKESLERGWKSKANFVEIEVSTEKEALAAAHAYSSLVGETGRVMMFDNMSVEEISAVLEKVNAVSGADQIVFEASGGITEKNLASYAVSGVDVVSMGSLTRTFPSVDIHLEMIS